MINLKDKSSKTWIQSKNFFENAEMPFILTLKFEFPKTFFRQKNYKKSRSCKIYASLDAFLA